MLAWCVPGAYLKEKPPFSPSFDGNLSTILGTKSRDLQYILSVISVLLLFPLSFPPPPPPLSRRNELEFIFKYLSSEIHHVKWAGEANNFFFSLSPPPFSLFLF